MAHPYNNNSTKSHDSGIQTPHAQALEIIDQVRPPCFRAIVAGTIYSFENNNKVEEPFRHQR